MHKTRGQEKVHGGLGRHHCIHRISDGLLVLCQHLRHGVVVQLLRNVFLHFC